MLGLSAMRRLGAMVLTAGLLSVGSAQAADAPRYDVPHGFTRCPAAVAWNGVFKWSSEQHTSCSAARRFMRRYAAPADGPTMPRHVAGYTCRIHYWRNTDNEIYASRHVCTRHRVTI